MTNLPTFRLSLLAPRYWLTWFGLVVLYLIVQLPYPILFRFGHSIGRLAMPFLKRRVAVAERNLKLCFPELTKKEIDKRVIRNFESTGMGLLETGMAWFWSDRRIKKWCKVENREYMDQAREGGKGVLLIGLHFLTLELGGRIFGMYNPGIGVYRPNDNKVLDWVQLRGRLRSNKSFIGRNDTKGMIRVLRAGEILWYAPDHDYGPKNSVFASLFAVPKAATTIGTSILMRMGKPSILPFTPVRNDDGSGYRVLVSPPVEGFPLEDSLAGAEFMNRIVEKEIMKAPDQYMWLHRRFKTRPEGEPSLYN